MKQATYFLFIVLLGMAVASCEKDEGKLPDIEFVTGTGYTSSDATVAAGGTVTIGIHAEKTEEEDVLKHFNISLERNGTAAISVYDQELTSAEEDEFDFDFSPTLSTSAGETFKFIFTITNRDGLTNQVSLTLTTN